MSLRKAENRTVLARVGQCIYCRGREDLRDEHIIPFGLGGRVVLEAASCRSCEAVTSAFEGRVMRGFMYRGRVTGALPTRRRKERPATSAVTYKYGTEGLRCVVPVSEDPALLHLPVLAEPGFLAGRTPTSGVHLCGVETLHFGPVPDEAIQGKLATGLIQADDLDTTSFARMLAKIGYCYVVGAVGLPPSDEVCVLPLILGATDDGSHWVGSAAFQTEAEKAGAFHVLAHTVYYSKGIPVQEVVVARIKLFASSGATGYEVVVRCSDASSSPAQID